MIDEPFPAAFNCRRALGQLVDERKQTPAKPARRKTWSYSYNLALRSSLSSWIWFLAAVGHSASASSKPYLRPSAMPCAIILTIMSASSLESLLGEVQEPRIRRARTKSHSQKSGLMNIFAILRPRVRSIYHSLNRARYAFDAPSRSDCPS